MTGRDITAEKAPMQWDKVREKKAPQGRPFFFAGGDVYYRIGLVSILLIVFLFWAEQLPPRLPPVGAAVAGQNLYGFSLKSPRICAYIDIQI